MADVFNAMKRHVDAIMEVLTANEIEDKAQSDLQKARDWLLKCQKESNIVRANENESKILLTAAINFARLNTIHSINKTTQNTGE